MQQEITELVSIEVAAGDDIPFRADGRVGPVGQRDQIATCTQSGDERGRLRCLAVVVDPVTVGTDR